MYQFRPVTDRISCIHDKIRDKVIQFDAERALITTESYQRNEHVIPIIKRALATRDVCSNMTLRVEEDELIVGNKSKNFCGNGVEPEWNGPGWIPGMVANNVWTLREDGLYHNPDGEELKMSISPEDLESLKSIAEYWKSRTVTVTADAWQPDGYDELCRLGVCSNAPGVPLMRMTAGHMTPGYQKILTVGYGAIRRQAQDWLDEHHNNLMGDDARHCLFYQSVTIICDAASTLIRRYGEACREKANVIKNATRRAELIKMADSLDWISENPVRNFWEACQAAILYQLFLALESRYPASSFGRFDQYTWPYLKSDLEKGTLTLDQAQEIVDSFFLKANSFYNAAPPAVSQITGIGNTYQHTTIGGVDPDTGKDATNPVTYMVLESMGRLSLHDPTISLRTNKDTPKELWECAIETTKLVGGLPLYQNDEVIIPNIIKELGFSLKDARNYAMIGCQEITGSGNDYSACNGISPPHASIHYGVVLSMAINNGINPINGEQCSIQNGYLYEMESFKEVRQAYKELALYCIKAQVSIGNYTEYLTAYHATLPGLSISMEGCMESGKDCTWGGLQV